jgi:glycosyltransferase involved in cell wall biosynthesis
LRQVDRESARRQTGLSGDPLCLWFGPLDSRSDPLTVLEGFSRTISGLGNPKLVMAYEQAPLLQGVEAWLAENSSVAQRVSLLSVADSNQLEDLYNGADIFLSSSRGDAAEASLRDALSCGIMPVVHDVPAFRFLTGCGRVGALWTPGNPQSCAEAIIHACAGASQLDRLRIREYFEAHLSYRAIGLCALELYSRLLTQSHVPVHA